ncbi:hypothetical protein AMK59_3408 [Oryctes borbonicus]|uniref:Uncharacterized protein n=1 Tax=Oryctes borbonicus TaxID=1629725 RepID=A0A0T6B918_9SCAR|nr:hypothetical protein AMK59_3408 [Oryctes borbonicus]
MSLWNLGLGVLCYIILIRVVHTIPNNNTNLENKIPESYLKLAEGNSLWHNLLHKCKTASFSCIKQTAYNYLDNLLDQSNNIQVTNNIALERNDIDYGSISRQSENDIDEDVFERSSPLEEVTGALHDKAVKFMMTHDLVVRLPEYFFDGALLKVSPRTFEGGGAIIKLDTFPGQGRIFFKKIKKFISNKLIVALLAILLVIKLIAVKFLFFMPMLVGAAAAKKLLLKVLLFLFPALSHLFKLCQYYSPTKYHHHQHHIKHFHHLSQIPSLHHTVELDHPPPGHGYDDHTFDYYSEGPGVAGNDYHRKDDKNQKLGDGYSDSIGGQGQPSYKRGTKLPPTGSRPLTPTEIENMILKAEKEATLKVRLQEEQKRVETDNKRIQENIKQLLKIQEKLKLQQALLKQTSKLANTNFIHTANIIPSQSLTPPGGLLASAHIVHPTVIQPSLVQALPIYQASFHEDFQPTAPSTTTTTTPQPVFDPFYTPILEKIDNILLSIGYTEEPCRERLICSMYKNPLKFSPHSNLLSTELSRDDLEKPTSTSAAVIRFYRYVQAARDGQDKRDCLRLYPACVINTEV